MEDKVFGTLTFDHGWIKKESLTLWGKEYTLDIRTSSYPNQEPNDKQRTAYADFEANLTQIGDDSQVKMAQFILSDHDTDIIGSLENVVNNLTKYIKPEEVLFFQDGSYAIECETTWNEDGVSILIEGQQMKVGYSDELLDSRI